MGEVNVYFKDQSRSDILKTLKTFQNEAYGLMENIRLAEQDYQNYRTMKIDNGSMIDLLQIFDDQEASEKWILRKQLLLAKKEAGVEEAYKNGYRFLNKVGAYFAGQGWQYSITLFGRQNVTFQMGIEEFLQLGEFHLRSGFKLLSSKTAIIETASKMANVNTIQWAKTLAEGKGRYNVSLFTAYRGAIQYARKVLRKNNQKDYSEGQILEGYMAFGESDENLSILSKIAEVTEEAKLKHLGQSTYHELQQIYSRFAEQRKKIYEQLQKQTNSRGFWTGGDTKIEGQVKGFGASIFSEDTIINQLNKFIHITENLNFDKLDNILNTKCAPEAKQALEHEIDKILKDVQNQFEATRENQSIMQQIKNSGDIDQIISSWFSS